MINPSTKIGLLAPTGLLLAAMLLLTSCNQQSVGGNAAVTAKSYTYGETHDLIGATDEQVSQFAVQYAQAQNMVKSGVPQVVLVQSVQREELTKIGINCPGTAPTIEKPPLKLVILKGNFDFAQGSIPGSTVMSAPQPASYIAYVFDVWAASPVFLNGSINGGLYREVLNDPNLPDDYPNQRAAIKANKDIDCPTPSFNGQLHYGDTPPIPTFPR